MWCQMYLLRLRSYSEYKVFLCVAECGSISQSAEQLYISQPAVSMTIKKLEESLGTTLFLRKPRGVVLTENGRLLYDGVKRAFESALRYRKQFKAP